MHSNGRADRLSNCVRTWEVERCLSTDSECLQEWMMEEASATIAALKMTVLLRSVKQLPLCESVLGFFFPTISNSFFILLLFSICC